MSNGQHMPDELAKVVRFAITLAHRIFNTLLAGKVVPHDQVKALVDTGRLLYECGEDRWPPMAEALRQLAETITPDTTEANKPPSQETAERE